MSTETVEIVNPYFTEFEPTHRVTIYMSGLFTTVKEVCQKFCLENSLCVTLKECDFVYNGGSEFGVEIGLVNFPKHPTTLQSLKTTATKLAMELLGNCYQLSILLVADDKTYWIRKNEAHQN